MSVAQSCPCTFLLACEKSFYFYIFKRESSLIDKIFYITPLSIWKMVRTPWNKSGLVHPMLPFRVTTICWRYRFHIKFEYTFWRLTADLLLCKTNSGGGKCQFPFPFLHVGVYWSGGLMKDSCCSLFPSKGFTNWCVLPNLDWNQSRFVEFRCWITRCA